MSDLPLNEDFFKPLGWVSTSKKKKRGAKKVSEQERRAIEQRLQRRYLRDTEGKGGWR